MAAATVRLSIIRGTAAITVILGTRTTATTRATTAPAGEVTIGLGGGIGIMAAGTGGADTAGTVVAGMAANGVAIIDSESRLRCPRVFLDSAHPRGAFEPTAIRCDIASKMRVASPKSEYRSNDV